MMRSSLTLIVLAALLVAVLAIPVFAQQGPQNPPPPGPGGRMKQRGGMPNAAMGEKMLERLGATEAEKTAIKDSMPARRDLTQAYQKELRPYFMHLRDASATSQQFAKDVADLEKAKAKYMEALAKLESGLKAKVSPKIQLALYQAGVFGTGAPMGMGPGGPGGRQQGPGGRQNRGPRNGQPGGPPGPGGPPPGAPPPPPAE